MFTMSKSQLSFFHFSSNHVFHHGSFIVFGSLLAPANSETYAAAACIVLFSSVRFRISVFLSTQQNLFTAHITFDFETPRNDFRCYFSFLCTSIMSCSNISSPSSCKTPPCSSTSLVTTSYSLLSLYRS